MTSLILALPNPELMTKMEYRPEGTFQQLVLPRAVQETALRTLLSSKIGLKVTAAPAADHCRIDPEQCRRRFRKWIERMRKSRQSAQGTCRG